MAFKTAALNLLLSGLKSAFTESSGMLVAKTNAQGSFIASVNIEFGTISNGEMDLLDTVEITIPAGNDVQALSLYTGTVTDNTSMNNEDELATISFPSGTYNYITQGTLSVESFKISIASDE